jgi:hypothetical protein
LDGSERRQLSNDRSRKSEPIDVFGMQQSPLRNTVRLERKG